MARSLIRGDLMFRSKTARYGLISGALSFAAIFWLLLAGYDPNDSANLSDTDRFGINRIADPDPSIRLTAVATLGKTQNPRAVEALITALKDPDADVRGRAAAVMGQIEDPQVVEPLIASLKDNEPVVRDSAAVALFQRKDRRTAELLDIALKDPDPVIRGRAIERLGEVGDTRNRDPNRGIKGSECQYSPSCGGRIEKSRVSP